MYSTNIGTEYFKHALYSPFFSLQNAAFFHNANLFGSCVIHILYTECAKIKKKSFRRQRVNRLTPNDPYMGRTAPLTSKRRILYIYSTNISAEYFKHALHSSFFSLFKMQFVS